MSLALAEDLRVKDAVADAVRRDLEQQRRLCDPAFNPNAAAYFIFNFCVTQDEERGGATCPLPAPFYSNNKPSAALRFVEFLERVRVEPVNGHDKKPRRKLHTWLVCLRALWELMWVPGTSKLLISKDQDHVDDGGQNSTPFSMLGRIRFAWERLPEHVRKPVIFSHLSARCPENDAYLIGKAPTQDAGRGGGFTGVDADEAAFIDFMATIMAAIDPACKTHKLLASTVNGPDNEFARVDLEQLDGWIFFDVDWWDEDPESEKIAGLRPTTPGPERDRYGEVVSDWFIKATASLTDEQIAQEYLKKYEKSSQGMILREWSRERHIAPRGTLKYDAGREVRVGVDLGHARKFAAVVGQPLARRRLDVIGCYEGENRTTRENADALASFLRSLGYAGRLPDVVMVLPHDAFNEEQGSGLELASWIRAAGFTRIVRPMIEGPDSVFLGNNVVRVCLQRDMIRIAEEAKPLIDAIPSYRLPIDRATGAIKSNKPVHNMASHPCDALRTIVTSLWTADDMALDWYFMGSGARREDKKDEPALTREALAPAAQRATDVGRFRPIVQTKRRF